MRRLALVAVVSTLMSVSAVGLAGARDAPPDPDPGEQVPSSAALDPVTAPDPDGGPPWVVRRTRTTKGWECEDVGRVADGKYGNVDADGTFYEYTQVNAFGCGISGDPGDPQTGSAITDAQTYEPEVGCADAYEPVPGRPTCLARGRRTVLFGRYGPHLTRVTFSDPDGTNQREPPVGPGGEYITVYRGDVESAVRQPRIRLYFDNGCTPEGRQWLDREGTRLDGCTVIVALDEPRPRPESAASKRARKNPSRPRKVTVNRRVGRPDSRIDVSFKVPITIQDYGEGYEPTITGPKSCKKKLASVGGWGDFTRLVRGKTFTESLPLGDGHGRWCRGSYTVSVAFQGHGAPTSKPFGSATFRIR